MEPEETNSLKRSIADKYPTIAEFLSSDSIRKKLGRHRLDVNKETFNEGEYEKLHSLYQVYEFDQIDRLDFDFIKADNFRSEMISLQKETTKEKYPTWLDDKYAGTKAGYPEPQVSKGSYPTWLNKETSLDKEVINTDTNKGDLEPEIE